MNALTEKSLGVFNFLKSVEGDITLEQVASSLGVPANSANGTIVALQKKGFVERVEAGSEIVNGKAKIVKYIKVTPAGMAYDHDAALAQDLAELEAAKEAKEAAKAAKEATEE